MHQLKFRAWDGKQMHLPEYSDKEDFHILPDGTIVETHEVGYERHEITSARTADWIVMQFIGLNDKTDTNIYEADIMKQTSETKRNISTNEVIKDPSWKIGIVEFNEGAYVLKIVAQHNSYFGKLPYYEKASYLKNFEIIGNIFENHELIPNEVK